MNGLGKCVMAAALVAAGVVGAEAPARADCSVEVALAVQAMGKKPFRRETHAIGENGPFKMVNEYQPPDRMHQVLIPLTENKEVEAIVVGEKAWTNNGSGWIESPPEEAQQLVTYMIKSGVQIYQEVGKFACVGLETVNGRELRAYRGLNPEPKTKEEKESTAAKNEAVRMIYLDPQTGLPARSIFAREGMLDKPLFSEDYTYPDDLKIEPPADVKKQVAPTPAPAP